MSHSILIGKLIYGALSQDSSIASYVGTSIFPLVAEAETDFPFICYSRLNVYDEYGTKDGWSSDKVQFQIVVESDKYDEACEIADVVRSLFENSILTNSTLKIYNVHMTSISESFGSDDYNETLIFECDCEDIESSN